MTNTKINKKIKENNGKKLTNGIDIAKNHAQSKGGECLSLEYINTHTKLEWKCKNPKHNSWFSKYTNIIHGKNWCPECSKETYKNSNKRLSNGLTKAKEHAKSKGGKCLSTEYIDSKSKLEWKCNNLTHPTWFSTYNGVLNRNNWCRQCNIDLTYPKENYFKLAKNHAISKGGLCLSKEYVNNNTKMEWKCHNARHLSWKAIYTSVINNNHWCPQCGIEEVTQSKVLKDGLERAKVHAISKNGECLSENYVHGHNKLEWKCQNATHNSWFAAYTNVVSSDSWCPQCGIEKNIQEFRVQQILNYLFKTSFIKNRNLIWNINPKTGRKLELDGYCENLKIAFEFQGSHHFEENVYKDLKLKDVQYRDQCKKENCIKNSIKLIVVDRVKDKKTCLNFFNNIKIGIINAGIEIPVFDYIEIEKLYKTIPQNDRQIKYYKKCQEYAKSKKGQCLSYEYNNINTPMEWKCHNENHRSWKSDYAHIVNRNGWCPYCSKTLLNKPNRKQIQLNKAKEYAISKKGECLSTEYINNYTKMEWKCHNPKHKFFYKSYTRIVSNKHWCVECSNCIKVKNVKLTKTKNKVLDISYKNVFKKDMKLMAREYAISKNGACLSKNYINNHTKMEWKCHNENHPSWFSSYNSVINNKHWCSLCGDNNSSEKQRNKNGLKDAQDYAKSKDGECLSTEYINSKTNLSWKCNNIQHASWLAKFENVVYNKTWCSECAGNKKLNGLVIAKDYAKNKKGVCLSTEYKNIKSKLEWKCHNENHPSFHKSYDHVITRNQWCPECYKYKKKKI